MSTPTPAGTSNRQFRLKQRPVGKISRDNFDLRNGPMPTPGPDQALVQTLMLSLDPTMRIWADEREQYLPPVQIGDVMRGGGVGRVLSSNNPRYKEGDLVSGMTGWQEFCLAGKDFSVLPAPGKMPIEAYVGVLGMTGMTAYFGLLELGKPKAGETLVVSAAAGAVGSVAGQIGKIAGCRVVGIAGSDEKCQWLTRDLGFDAAINYKQTHWRDQLKAACPQGIDINFENVGGEIMDGVLSNMNLHGRVVLCGLIAGYNENPKAALGNFSTVLMRRLSVQGFIILDYISRMHEATRQLGAWAVEGKVKQRETVVEGFDKLPEALTMLFDGSNTGKLMVRVAS